MPELMISDEYRLRNKLNKQIKKNRELVQANNEKDVALQHIAELEAKVERMQRYQITNQ